MRSTNPSACFLFLAILLSLGGLIGCDAELSRSNPYDENAPADEQVPATVRGAVLLEQQNEGEQDAVSVTLEGPGQTLTTTTSADGSFAFQESVMPGNWLLRFNMTNYQEVSYGPFDASVAGEVTIPTVNLKLRRASLSGAVRLEGVDDSGNALEDFSGVRILARQTSGVSAKRVAKLRADDDDDDNDSGDDDVTDDDTTGQTERSYSATTDENGNFYLDEVPFGDYDLVAGKDGFSSAAQEVSVGEDQVQISGIVLVSSLGALSLNDGNDVTNNPTVNALLKSSGPMKRWWLSEDPDFEDETTISGEIETGVEADFVESPFTLKSGDGNHVVYGKYETLAGLPSELSSAIILLDTTAPQNISVTINNNDTYFTDAVVNLTLAAQDRHSEVTGMRLCLDGVFDDEPVQDFTLSETVTLPVPNEADGQQFTVSVRFLDGAGNESEETSDDILFDNTAPQFGTTAMQINEGDAATAQATVSLDFDISGADLMKLSNDSGLGSANWESFRASVSGWRLADGTVEGEKTVYAQFKDNAGNETSIIQASINLQTKGTLGGTLSFLPADTEQPYENITFTLDGQSLSDVSINEAEGRFTLNEIQHGIYSSLTVSKTDFLPVQIPAVVVEPMQTTDVGTIQLASRYGSISGTLSVVPADTEEPFDGVSFLLDGRPLGSGLGDVTLDEQTGAFTITRIPTGTYGLLRVRKSGFDDATAMGLVVSAEGATELGTLSLVSQVGRLFGTLSVVADDASNAYQDLSWFLDNQVLGEGFGVIDLNTDEGSFSISEIPTGTYGALHIRKTGFQAAQSGIVRVQAAEAQDLGALTLTGSTGTITGSLAFVPENTPNPLDGLTFSLDGQALGSGLGEITLTEESSTFSISGIPNGLYSSLTVRKTDFQETTSRALTVQAGSPVDLGSLTLSSLYGSITGTISLEASPLVTEVSLYLGTQELSEASIAENGTFTLDRIAVGNYSALTARKDGYTDASTPMITVTSGETVNIGSMSLLLSRGNLEGTVQLVGRGDHSGVILSLIGTSHSMVSDASGYFFKDNIIAGNYSLVLQKDGFQQKTIPVSIEPDETTTVDTQQLSPQSGDFRVADGAAYTNQTTVDLELEYDNAAMLRVSEEDTFYLSPDVTEPAFVSITDLVDASLLTIDPDGTMHLAYTFETGDSGEIEDGFKTIYLQFQDTEGLNSSAYSASITLDRVAPSMAEITINGDATYTNSSTGLVTLSLSAYDENDVEFVYLSKNGTTFTSSSYVPSKSYILADPQSDGEKTVWAYFVDPAGNQSETVFDTILLDTEPPQFVAFEVVAEVESESVKYTTRSSVNLVMEVNGATQMMLSNTSGFTGAVWEPYVSSRVWVLPNLEQEHTVYARFKDDAGNMIGSEGTIHDSITLDLTPPPTPEFTLTGDNIVGTNANGEAIQLQFTNAPADVQVQVSTAMSFTEAAFDLPVGGMVDYNLPDQDGSHIVYARYIDLAGNTSDPAQRSITLDRSGPYGERLSVSGGSVQASLSVTLELSAVGASEVLVSAGSTCSGSTWTPYVTQMAVTASGSDGEKTFSARFRDEAHNESNCIGTSFTVDRQAPTLSVEINEGALYANSRGVTLSLTASDGANGTVSSMRITNEASFGSETWEPFQADKSWMLTSGSDTKTVRVQVRDEAGNTREATDQILLDLSSPTGVSLSIQDTNGYVQSSTVTLTLSATDNLTDAAQLVYQLSNSPSFSNAVSANYQDGGVTRTWELSPGDGEKNVYLRVMDLAGNLTETSDSTVLDSSGPNGSSVSLAEGSYVSSPDVTLLAQSPGADEMQITGDVTDTASTFEWIDFAASTSLELDESACDDGLCELQVSFRDAAGYSDGPISLNVMLDEQAPTGTLVINEDASHTDTRAVTLSLSVSDDRTGISSMRLTNSASFTTEEWEPFVTEKSWTLQSDNGTRAVLAQVKDAAGNVRSLTDSIILDTQAPTDLAISIENDDSYTTSRTVDITLDAMDNLSDEENLTVLLSNDSSFMEATEQDLVEGGITVSWTLSEGDGTKIVYLRVMDEAGNIDSAMDSIVLDSQLPQATLSIMGDDPTNATSATLVFTASSDVSLMRIENTDNINCATGSYEPYSSQKAGWLLGDSSGETTVSACFKDAAGNTVSVRDSVTLDLDNPTGTLSINEGETITAERMVTLSLSNIADATSSVTQMRVTNAPSFGSQEWEAFTAERSWTLASTNGLQTVRVQIRDEAGNSTELTDDIVLDNQSPENVVIRINDDALQTGSRTVSVYVDASDNIADSDELTFQLSNTTSFNNATSYTLTPGGRTFPDWTLTSGDGEKNVTVRFTDTVGNITDATAFIMLDTTEPEAAVEILGADPTNQSLVTVNLPVFDAPFIKWAVSDAIDCTSGVTEPFPMNGRLEGVNLGLTSGTVTVSVCFKDEAGNTASASDSVTLDLDDPTGSLVIEDNAAATNSREVTLSFTTSDTTTSVTDVRISNEAGFLGIDWEPMTTPRSWLLKAENGTQTVRAELRDEAGNTRIVTDSIILDTEEPTNLTINVSSGTMVEGMRYVSNSTITATVDAEDNISNLAGLSFYLSNEPSFSNATTALADLTDFSWTLSEGDGEKNVYLKVVDETGNSATTMTTLFLDTEAPTASLTVLGDDPTRHQEISLVFEASSDVTMMKLENTASISCATGVDDPLPPSHRIDNWPLGDSSGVITISACFKDQAGNTVSTNTTVTLDLDRPTGTLTIEADDPTNSPSVNLAITGSSDVEGMALVNGDGLNCETAPYEPFSSNRSWMLPEPTGQKTVTLCLRDEAGNTNNVQIQDSIFLDLTPPEIDVTLGDGSGIVTSNLTTLHFDPAPAADTNQVWKYSVQNLASFSCGTISDWASMNDYPATGQVANYDLSTRAGQQETVHVTVCFADRAGNTQSQTRSIYVDRKAPVGSINLNATYYRDDNGDDLVEANVTISASEDVTEMAILPYITTFVPDCSSASYEDFSNSKTIPLLQNDPSESGVTNYVWVCLKDEAGNITDFRNGATYIRDTCIVDTNPPSGTATIETASPSNSPYVLVTFSSVSPDVDFMALSNESQSCAEANYMNYTTSIGWELPAEDGSHTVHVCFKDKAGNTGSDESNAMVLDLTPPTAPTPLLPLDNGFTTTDEPTLSWTEAEGGNTYMIYWEVGGTERYAGPTANLSYTIPSVLALPENGYVSWWVTSYDTVGNSSEPSPVHHFTVDTQAPTVSSIQINGGASYTRFTSAQIKMIGVSGAHEMMVACDGVLDTEQWIPYNPVHDCNLPDGDGTKTVRARFRDEAGNEGPATYVQDTIILDQTPPAPPVIYTEPSVVSSSSVSFMIDGSCSDSGSGCITGPSIEIKGGSSYANWTYKSSYDVVSPENGWTISLRTNVSNKLSARYIDRAGNTSTEEFVIIRHDSIKPARPTDTTITASDRTLKLSWTPSTSSDVAGYKIYYDFDDYTTGLEDFQGNFAHQGQSPITVGKITTYTLTGLTNDMPIDVFITAFDETEEPGPNESDYASAGVATGTPMQVPITMEGWGLGGEIDDMVVYKGWVYTVSKTNGVQVYRTRDIIAADGEDITPVGTLTGEAVLRTRLEHYGNYLYLYDDGWNDSFNRLGVTVVNVGDPSNPSLEGETLACTGIGLNRVCYYVYGLKMGFHAYNTTDTSRNGLYAMIAVRPLGYYIGNAGLYLIRVPVTDLTVLDITSMNSTYDVLEVADTSGDDEAKVHRMDIDSRYAYLTTEHTEGDTDRVSRVYIRDPVAAMTLSSQRTLPTAARDLVSSYPYSFVASKYGMYILDSSGNVDYTFQVDTANAGAIQIAPAMAFIGYSEGDKAVRVISLNTHGQSTGSLNEIGSYRWPTSGASSTLRYKDMTAMKLEGNYLYATFNEGATSGLAAFKISTPARFDWKHQISSDTGYDFRGFAVHKDMVYAAHYTSPSGVSAYRIWNAESPDERWTLSDTIGGYHTVVRTFGAGYLFVGTEGASSSTYGHFAIFDAHPYSSSYAQMTYESPNVAGGGISDADIHGNALILNTRASTCVKSYDLSDITDVTFGDSYYSVECHGVFVNSRYIYSGRKSAVSSRIYTYRLDAPDPIANITSSLSRSIYGNTEYFALTGNADYILGWQDPPSGSNYILYDGSDMTTVANWTESQSTSSGVPVVEYYGANAFMSTGSIWDMTDPTTPEAYAEMPGTIHEMHVLGAFYFIRNSSISGYQMEP